MSLVLRRAVDYVNDRWKKLWPSRNRELPADLEPEFLELAAKLPHFKTVSVKMYTTFKTVQYLCQNKIAGDFVECGVYEGRQVAVMAATLLHLGETTRDIYLYDTFAGMTEPCALDARIGRTKGAEQTLDKWKQSQEKDHNTWCYAALETVRRNVLATGYPEKRLHFIAGDVRKTIPNDHHKSIAFLRLDTDWYELTRHELEHMYSKVSPHGVVTIDDYGTWDGARQATDNFLETLPFRPMLFRTYKSERVMLKTA